jgi:hypothetical protein
VLTRVLHWSLSWARLIQSIPSHPISLRFILKVFTHLSLGLPSGLFHSSFPINILHAFLPHSCYMPCPSHPPWLDHSNYTWRRVQVMKLIMQFSPTSSHFISLWFKYSPQHLFSNTLSLRSSLNIKDQVSHPYIATGKIIALYIQIFCL